MNQPKLVRGLRVETPHGSGVIVGFQKVLWSDDDFVYVVYEDNEFRHYEEDDLSRRDGPA